MESSAQLTAQDILDHVYATFRLAYESGQCNAALKACEMLGREKGLFKDRRENLNINLGNMTWEQTEQYLTERYGDKAIKLIDYLKQYYSNTEAIKSQHHNPAVIQHNPAVIQPLDVVGPRIKTPYLVVDNQDCDE